jgi:hypothetical protein
MKSLIQLPPLSKLTHCLIGLKATQMDEKRVDRLQVMLAPEELQALDNWRFKCRMPSRASAVRELLKRGLAAEGFLKSHHNAKSSDFGVTDETSRMENRS